LNKILEFDSNLDDYVKQANLEKNDLIKQFLKMRLNLLFASYEQHKLKNKGLYESLSSKNGTKTQNSVFVDRLILDEKSLLKKTIEMIQ
jgi:hypothetical protein